MPYENWISDKPLRFSEDLIWMYERFLVGSLAIGASLYGGSFHEVLDLPNSTAVEALLNHLQDNRLSISFVDRIEDVETHAGALISGDGETMISSEFCILFRTEKEIVTNVVKNLREYAENGQTGLSEEANKIVARRYYELDSLLRHIRNALAHGCFKTRMGIDGEGCIFIFDMNQDDRLTAIMQLTFARLRDWYEEFCRLAQCEL